MTNEVATINYSTAMQEFKEREELCQLMAQNPHYSSLGVAGVRALVAKATTLKMDPFDAVNGRLYYVKGKVGMSTEEMAARMRAAGHSVKQDIERCTPTCVALVGKRKDSGDVWYTSFSIEDAKRAGLMTPNSPWYKYPLVMCYNRAMSQMFRQLTPDLSLGAGYTMDELQEMTTDEPKKAPAIEEQPKLMSTEQAYRLQSVYEECDPEYVAQVMKSLHEISNGRITKIDQADEHLFPRLLMAAEKNRREYLNHLYLNNLKEEPVEEEEDADDDSSGGD